VVSLAELTLIGAWVAVFLPSMADWAGVYHVLSTDTQTTATNT